MNRVIHFDLYAKDPERAMKFYKEIFSWEFEKWEDESMEKYWMIKTGSDDKPGINGGMIRRKGEEPIKDTPIRGFVCTIGVDDVEKYVEKVKMAGGTIAMDATKVEDMGTMASFRDTEGNSVGLMQLDDRDR